MIRAFFNGTFGSLIISNPDIGMSASSDLLPEPVLAFLRRAGLARPGETPPAAAWLAADLPP